MARLLRSARPRPAVAGAVIAAALGVAGCGADAPAGAGTTGPTDTGVGNTQSDTPGAEDVAGAEIRMGEIRRQVEEGCARLREELGSMPTPASPADEDRWEEGAAEAEQRYIEELRALEVPEPQWADFDDYIAAQERAFAARTKARTEEPGEQGAGLEAAQDADAEAERLGSELGFTTCSSV